jgi:hypothetical protein
MVRSVSETGTFEEIWKGVLGDIGGGGWFGAGNEAAGSRRGGGGNGYRLILKMEITGMLRILKCFVI